MIGPFESYDDDKLELEISSEKLGEVFDELALQAARRGWPHPLHGLAVQRGELPVEYRLPIDPGMAQQLFHPRDESLVVTQAMLLYQPPACLEPSGQGSPEVGFAGVDLSSLFSADPSKGLSELFTITVSDGHAEADVTYQYVTSDGRMLRMDEPELDEADTTAEDLEKAAESSLDGTRRFRIEDLEAFEALLENLQDEA